MDGFAESLFPLVMLFTSSWGACGGGALSGASPTTSNSTSRSRSSLASEGDLQRLAASKSLCATLRSSSDTVTHTRAGRSPGGCSPGESRPLAGGCRFGSQSRRGICYCWLRKEGGSSDMLKIVLHLVGSWTGQFIFICDWASVLLISGHQFN